MSCSQETAAKIDDLVVALVQKQYEKAKNLLNSHMDKLHEISKFLYEKTRRSPMILPIILEI